MPKYRSKIETGTVSDYESDDGTVYSYEKPLGRGFY